MDICGLFALAVSIWQTCVFWKDLSWQVLLYQWGYSFPATLYYLLMAAIVVVCAGALTLIILVMLLNLAARLISKYFSPKGGRR